MKRKCIDYLKRILFKNDYRTESYIYHCEKYMLSGCLLKFYHLYCAKRILDSFNAQIPMGMFSTDKNPVFPHGLSVIYISQNAKIGKNVVIFHQVTIGSNTLPNSKHSGAPVIGDNVYIGAGAKIIGGIKVGNNVRIGANAIVSCDIPNNATVVLVSSRILIRSTSVENSFIPISEF